MNLPPVIIEAALNGVTLKLRNPHVPEEPEEVAADALRCLEAGAAIIHNNIADISLEGVSAAEEYLKGWRPVLEAWPDALLYPTVGISGGVEQRFQHFEVLAKARAVRIGIVDPGSVNLGGADEEGLPVPV